MILKKLFIILLLSIITIWNTFAINSNDYFYDFDTVQSWQTYTETATVWQDIYIDGIHIFSDISIDVMVYDWLHLIYDGTVNNDEVILENIIIKDDLIFINDDNKDLTFHFSGFHFAEWQDISNIINNKEDGVNKPIFDEYTIQEIYLYEWILMLFIVIFTFFARLLWYKKKKKNKFL